MSETRYGYWAYKQNIYEDDYHSISCNDTNVISRWLLPPEVKSGDQRSVIALGCLWNHKSRAGEEAVVYW